MCREAARIVLTDLEAIHLQRLARAHSTPQVLAFRARLVLRCAAADKPRNDHVAAELGCDADTVSKWRHRFRRQRVSGLLDLRVRADRGLFPPEDRHKLVCLATTQPADLGVATARWSLDDLAYHILRQHHYRDMSRSTIWRVLSEVQLRPHRSRYWLPSDDPDFETKVLDICRLYLDAPRLYRQSELVVCADEKTGIQALQRARPTRTAAPPTRRTPRS
jgi:putative transposase